MSWDPPGAFWVSSGESQKFLGSIGTFPGDLFLKSVVVFGFLAAQVAFTQTVGIIGIEHYEIQCYGIQGQRKHKLVWQKNDRWLLEQHVELIPFILC